MAFNVTILACKLENKDILLGQLQLTETEVADHNNACQFSFGVLGYFYLVRENWRPIPSREVAEIAEFSHACPIFGCYVSEWAKWSLTALFDDGCVSWSVTHTKQVALDDIKVTGEPPHEWDDILRKLQSAASNAKDKEVDYFFDAPTRIFQSVTGFKYDEGHCITFRALEKCAVTTAKKPFWKFWA